MTNQEIEKRFLFDLEMGRFKQYSNFVIFRNMSFLDEAVMTKLLKNIGYKKDYNLFMYFNNMSHQISRGKTTITINKESKIYLAPYTVMVSSDEHMGYINEIPDYIIMGYKL